MKNKQERDMEEILDDLLDIYQLNSLVKKQISSDEEAKEQTTRARTIIYGEAIKN